MKIEVINGISSGTKEILSRKVGDRKVAERILEDEYTAVGLCQGTVIEVIVASDIAEKTSEVTVVEIHGLCPQHITTLGVFGDITAVEAALAAIERRMNK
ncbi:MAG: BMC domain-containing protein [Eubacteriaceae bacterium]|jgi:ethanolamine utilization microcompartment shell protein EutS|nr:hypothetical protein [Eubacteriaceae bacterium]